MTPDDLREAYDQFDRDQNGSIDSAEFTQLIAVLDPGMPDEQIAIGFGEIDENSDGVIDFSEFETWWQDR